MADIGGEPMLVRVVERARRAATLDQVVLATTTDESDDVIEQLCIQRGYDVFRGNLHDVLDRYYQTALSFRTGIIVRITADCPLIDPGVIDDTVNAFSGQLVENDHINLISIPPQPDFDASVQGTCRFDFAANRLPLPWKRTYPIGLDTEVCTLQALGRAWKEADQPHQREHVMPYLYEQEGRFRILLVNHEPDFGDWRWAVDTFEDLELVRRTYAYFGNRNNFSWKEVLALFERQPDLAGINKSIRQKIYDEVDSRRNLLK